MIISTITINLEAGIRALLEIILGEGAVATICLVLDVGYVCSKLRPMGNACRTKSVLGK